MTKPLPISGSGFLPYHPLYLFHLQSHIIRKFLYRYRLMRQLAQHEMDVFKQPLGCADAFARDDAHIMGQYDEPFRRRWPLANE